MNLQIQLKQAKRKQQRESIPENDFKFNPNITSTHGIKIKFERNPFISDSSIIERRKLNFGSPSESKGRPNIPPPPPVQNTTISVNKLLQIEDKVQPGTVTEKETDMMMAQVPTFANREYEDRRNPFKGFESSY